MLPFIYQPVKAFSFMAVTWYFTAPVSLNCQRLCAKHTFTYKTHTHIWCLCNSLASSFYILGNKAMHVMPHVNVQNRCTCSCYPHGCQVEHSTAFLIVRRGCPLHFHSAPCPNFAKPNINISCLHPSPKKNIPTSLTWPGPENFHVCIP